jgi:DNA-binding TFAR19-related protein (PDSD5 family)
MSTVYCKSSIASLSSCEELSLLQPLSLMVNIETQLFKMVSSGHLKASICHREGSTVTFYEEKTKTNNSIHCSLLALCKQLQVSLNQFSQLGKEISISEEYMKKTGKFKENEAITRSKMEGLQDEDLFDIERHDDQEQNGTQHWF